MIVEWPLAYIYVEMVFCCLSRHPTKIRPIFGIVDQRGDRPGKVKRVVLTNDQTVALRGDYFLHRRGVTCYNRQTSCYDFGERGW